MCIGCDKRQGLREGYCDVCEVFNDKSYDDAYNARQASQQQAEDADFLAELAFAWRSAACKSHLLIVNTH